MAEITLTNVSKRYADGTIAVDNVNLDIADGEFVILVGPSGCGKSTLLRMIVGLEDISGGELTIGGKEVNNLAPRDRNLAMVFQNYALYPHLSVRENIAFPLRMAKVSESEVTQRVDEAARVLELGELLERKPGALSGGQRQRVAMGRAIVREPEAFLFDEPLSNLDAKLRGQMRTEIARLQKRFGTTTVYVTHDQTEAMTLGDRVAVLRKGVLQQVGTPRELYNSPVNLFVAGFIGSPSMNFLPATLTGHRLRLPIGEVDLPSELTAGLPAEGRERSVIAGIRPEHFEDVSLIGEEARHGTTFSATIDVIEWMGSELYAYFPVRGADQGHQAGMAELARELDQEGVRSDTDESQVVARLDPTSQVRESVEAQLWLDVRRIHLFDPETGENLTLPPGDPLGAGHRNGDGDAHQGVSGPDSQTGQGDPLQKHDDAYGAPGSTGSAATGEHDPSGETEPPRSGGAHRA
ncbi:MAG: multiple sugar transport system ATP-binding protein [Frankiaceae bacterium]|nr:multiple sugar transport system ATP-binding protein [Frankiaceae bacterium]